MLHTHHQTYKIIKHMYYTHIQHCLRHNSATQILLKLTPNQPTHNQTFQVPHHQYLQNIMNSLNTSANFPQRLHSNYFVSTSPAPPGRQHIPEVYYSLAPVEIRANHSARLLWGCWGGSSTCSRTGKENMCHG